MQGSHRVEKMRPPHEKQRAPLSKKARKEVTCVSCHNKFMVKKGKTTYCPRCRCPYNYR